jgi:hypothetical protein
MFTSAFNGAKRIQMFANGGGGLASGWQDRGGWTVSSSSPAPSPTPTPTPPPSTPPPPTVQPGVNGAAVLPGSGSGSNQTFALQYTDSRGAANLLATWVWFNGGTGICLAYYERPSNTLYLINDTNTAWTGRTLSSGGTLQNSSCTIAVGSSSVQVSGQILTLNLAVTFKPAFRGTKTIQMFANGGGGLTSGWQNRGSWIVP